MATTNCTIVGSNLVLLNFNIYETVVLWGNYLFLSPYSLSSTSLKKFLHSYAFRGHAAVLMIIWICTRKQNTSRTTIGWSFVLSKWNMFKIKTNSDLASDWPHSGPCNASEVDILFGHLADGARITHDRLRVGGPRDTSLLPFRARGHFLPRSFLSTKHPRALGG